MTCRHVFEDFQANAGVDYRARVADLIGRPGEVVRWGDAVRIEALFFLEEDKQWKCIPVSISDALVSTEVDICVIRAAAEHFRPHDASPYPIVKLGDSNTLVIQTLLRKGRKLLLAAFPMGTCFKGTLVVPIPRSESV